MGKVEIKIHGRLYAIGCEDGQENHIRGLADQFDGYVRELAGSVGEIGENRLFLMAALMLADELYEARSTTGSVDTAALETEIARKTAKAHAVAARAADLFDAAAERVEKLAETIERA